MIQVDPPTPDQLKVIADRLLEMGLDKVTVDRALSAIDTNPIALWISGGSLTATDISNEVGRVIEFAGEPPVAVSPMGYVALLDELASLRAEVERLKEELDETSRTASDSAFERDLNT